MRAVKAPLAQVPLVAVGGVREENALDFLRAGASILAVGGNLVTKDRLARRDFAAITESARRFVQAIRQETA